MLPPEAPVVAIIGRPNVGKSSLLNRIAGRRISIVDPTSGVTRDRVTAWVEHAGRAFEVWDTGGIGLLEGDELAAEIQHQIDVAVRRADVVLFVVDARDGRTALDEEIAASMRRLDKPVFLVANKVEGARLENDLGELYRLGLGDPRPVSAQEGEGINDLLDEVVEALGDRAPPAADAVSREEDGAPELGSAARPLRIAIVGRRNVGKSTLLNALAREERVIVSELPGTTRDSVDVRFEKDGRVIVAIDTAGMVRRPKSADSIQFYSQVRADAAIRRADVVLLVLDVSEPVGQVDKRIAETILRHFKPVVIAANKWDLAADRVTTGAFTEYLADALVGLHFAPIIYLTAKEGRNVQSTLDVAQALANQASRRVGTGELNRVIEEATRRRGPPPSHGRSGKVLYCTQSQVRPPTVVLFVNDKKLFPAAYLRYLENRLREGLAYPEIPVRIVLRGRGDEEEPPERRPPYGRGRQRFRR